MSDGDDSNNRIRHLVGLATASVLVAICWGLWEEASWLADLLSVPEFRTLIALTGSFLVLSFVHFLTVRQT